MLMSNSLASMKNHMPLQIWGNMIIRWYQMILTCCNMLQHDIRCYRLLLGWDSTASHMLASPGSHVAPNAAPSIANLWRPCRPRWPMGPARKVPAHAVSSPAGLVLMICINRNKTQTHIKNKPKQQKSQQHVYKYQNDICTWLAIFYKINYVLRD